MPGSTTIGRTERLVMLSHHDAERLAETMRRLSEMLAADDADRMTDPQVAKLCGGDAAMRGEYAHWAAEVGAFIRGHL
ncbi:hypothetical protein [Streptacidiphilus jiangxiensis]|uniref:Uncharacterized protein n=1 Tax=Streptacidiphilus jiangxiensis TaxID=235985 RepID=A0A1H7U636_STRJI|nr:hypothetical protein [Streptacidiphilus jiangxiensis]SEL92441.1 hypothetical protein SAMN05414137_11599 [Streptacidiphilus jiangxiensis]